MGRDGVRGFVRRSLPALLALLLSGSFSAAAAVTPVSYAAPVSVAAVAQVEQSAAQEPPAAPVERTAEASAALVVAGAPQVLHPQAGAGVRGSRAPPALRV